MLEPRHDSVQKDKSKQTVSNFLYHLSKTFLFYTCLRQIRAPQISHIPFLFCLLFLVRNKVAVQRGQTNKQSDSVFLVEGPVTSLRVETSGIAEVQRTVYPKAKSSESVQASVHSFSPTLQFEVSQTGNSVSTVFFKREKSELALDQSMQL